MRRILGATVLLALLVPTGNASAGLKNPIDWVKSKTNRLLNAETEVRISHPPTYDLQLGNVAFLPSASECAEEVVGALVQEFVLNGVQPLDRQTVARVLEEHDLARSGIIDPSTAIEIGKMVGAQTLVVVDVRRCSSATRRESGESQSIAYRDFFLKVSLRLISVKTNRISAANEVVGNSTLNERSYSGEPAFPSEFEAKDQSLRTTATQAARLFFPWEETVKTIVFDGKKCGMEAAVHQLAIGELSQAERALRQGIEGCLQDGTKKKKIAKARYNLGTVLLAQGQLESAKDALAESYSLEPGNETIAQAYRRTVAAIESRNELQAMTSIERSSSADPMSNPQGSDSGGVRADETAVAFAKPDVVERLDRMLRQGLIDDVEYLAKLKKLLETGQIERRVYDDRRRLIIDAL